MCFPFCIWNTNNFKKVHPKVKKPSPRKMKFFYFSKSFKENK